MQAGRYVAADNLGEATGSHRPVHAFRYRDKGTMATIGRRAAVADVHGLRLRGTLGWLAWLLVHIYYLIGFRNRAVVLASWGWNYLRKDRPIRLIARSGPDEAATSLDPEVGPS
jgi:NADH dehydrogenase